MPLELHISQMGYDEIPGDMLNLHVFASSLGGVYFNVTWSVSPNSWCPSLKTEFIKDCMRGEKKIQKKNIEE